jgi:hypothetical protein
MEIKQLFLQDELFLNPENQEVKNNVVRIVGLTAWF